jgi:hypothetical protein
MGTELILRRNPSTFVNSTDLIAQMRRNSESSPDHKCATRRNEYTYNTFYYYGSTVNKILTGDPPSGISLRERSRN